MNSPNPPGREKEIFEQALDLPSAETRQGFVQGACRGDPDLLARVQALLRAHDAAGGFLPDNPVASGAATAGFLAASTEEKPGTVIGRYKILQKIGEGGCGVVYMAEQEVPMRRRVALKVIKLGMDTKAVVARFEAERQALAMMDHPNIAKVLDGGATETGRPYFVMELVRGIPITKYCDESHLPTTQRLELFSHVCQAVQHAHQKGIIHRDLKPSNILVTLHDGVPVPKVIDFGIAKATQGRLTDSTLFTAFEQFIGTPAYMSPEQAELSGLDIDTRSDIYSLGVLLYELLAGRPPFDPQTFVALGLDEMRRMIREIDPPRPSIRLSTLTNADRTTVARLRGTLPAQLTNVLAGDLDWIVMRCLEKDRTRRYETPSALAADLQRHMANEVVEARPPSLAYRFNKFTRRHRVVVMSAGAVLLALLVGLGATLVAWRQAVAQQRATQLARAQAEDLVGFIMHDLQPSLLAHGRVPVVKKTIRAAIRYFQDLPPELRNLSARRGHAQALEALVAFSGRVLVNPAGEENQREAHEAAQQALRLRRTLIAADPNDADSAAAEIEDELYVANNSGHADAIDWSKLHADSLQRLRELERRFPQNLRVQRGMADELSNRGWWATDLAAARDASQRWEQLMAAHPEDMTLRADYVLSLGGFAAAYQNKGETQKSFEAGEKTVAAAQAALKLDPTNFQLLSIAAAMTREFVWWSEPVSRTRAIEASRTARQYYQKLMELDPTNPGWREKDQMTAGFEAFVLLQDNQKELARRKLDELIARGEPASSAEAKHMLMDSMVLSGELAAAAGDLPMTRARLQSIRDELKEYPLVVQDHSLDRVVAHFAWLRAQARLNVALQDWPELARLSRAMIDETERGMEALPIGVVQLRPRRADAKGFLGKALLRQGRANEAVALLQEAVAGLRDEDDWTFARERRDDLAALKDQDLPEALKLAGETTPAPRTESGSNIGPGTNPDK